MTDSNRGILTEADREFLAMDASDRLDEYSRSAISQRRSAIRKRVYQGLSDLAFLFHNLPKGDRNDVFEMFEDGFVLHPLGPLLRHSTAFLFTGVIEQENVGFDDEEYYEYNFNHIIEMVLFDIGMGADKIDVDVTIEGWDHPNEGLKAADLTELSEEKLRLLLFDGEISSEEFAHGILDRDDE